MGLRTGDAMRRVAVGTVLAVVVLALTMLSAGGAFAWKGPNEKCNDHINAQQARGVDGNGSKEGVPGPTNCDHVFGGPVD
jgi:hypothetical protein